MSDNNTARVQRLVTWSIRLLLVLAVCFLAGCRLFTVN